MRLSLAETKAVEANAMEEIEKRERERRCERCRRYTGRRCDRWQTRDMSDARLAGVGTQVGGDPICGFVEWHWRDESDAKGVSDWAGGPNKVIVEFRHLPKGWGTCRTADEAEGRELLEAAFGPLRSFRLTHILLSCYGICEFLDNRLAVAFPGTFAGQRIRRVGESTFTMLPPSPVQCCASNGNWQILAVDRDEREEHTLERRQCWSKAWRGKRFGAGHAGTRNT
jgi:hypothetical protein